MDMEKIKIINKYSHTDKIAQIQEVCVDLDGRMFRHGLFEHFFFIVDARGFLWTYDSGFTNGILIDFDYAK